MKTVHMVYAALFAALIAVLGLLPPLPLPFIPVPVTAQTLGVMLAGAFLGKRLGGISVLVLVLVVAAGAPLLAGGRGGMGIVLGPTGGYLLSWPVAAFLIGWGTEVFWNKLTVVKLFFLCLIGGVLLINIIGASYLAFITNISWLAALGASAAFLPGDVLKAVLASIIFFRLARMSVVHKKKQQPAGRQRSVV